MLFDYFPVRSKKARRMSKAAYHSPGASCDGGYLKVLQEGFLVIHSVGGEMPIDSRDQKCSRSRSGAFVEVSVCSRFITVSV